MDIQQLWVTCGKPHKSIVRPDKPSNQHNSLADANWNFLYWDALTSYYDGLLLEIAETGKTPKWMLKP